MDKATIRELGGPGREPVKVRRCDVVREASAPSGWAARGITTSGALVRVPVPGATLDGVALEVPNAEAQRRLAPESSVWNPGDPTKPAPAAVAVPEAPAEAPAAPAPKRATRAK